MLVGAKIKLARERLGMTQEELGKRIGVQSSAIAKYEKGRVTNIRQDRIKALADALGLRPSALIDDDDFVAEDFKNREQLEDYINETINRKIADIKVDYKISVENQEFLIEYEKLSNESKNKVKDFIKFISQSENA